MSRTIIPLILSGNNTVEQVLYNCPVDKMAKVVVEVLFSSGSNNAGTITLYAGSNIFKSLSLIKGDSGGTSSSTANEIRDKELFIGPGEPLNLSGFCSPNPSYFQWIIRAIIIEEKLV